jgi:hypothetical protein
MIDEEKLKEKLKYLIISNGSDLFNFEDDRFDFEFQFEDDNSTILFEYDMDMIFDYQGSIEPDVYDFTQNIRIMADKLHKIVSQYVVTKEGKISLGKNYESAFVHEGYIWSLDFQQDAKHMFNMSFKVTYVS